MVARSVFLVVIGLAAVTDQTDLRHRWHPASRRSTFAINRLDHRKPLTGLINALENLTNRMENS